MCVSFCTFSRAAILLSKNDIDPFPAEFVKVKVTKFLGNHQLWKMKQRLFSESTLNTRKINGYFIELQPFVQNLGHS